MKIIVTGNHVFSDISFQGEQPGWLIRTGELQRKWLRTTDVDIPLLPSFLESHAMIIMQQILSEVTRLELETTNIFE